jgi:hypothetical protein
MGSGVVVSQANPQVNKKAAALATMVGGMRSRKVISSSID